MLNLPVTVDVPLRTDEYGVIRVGETRVTLITIVGRHLAGDSPQMIQEAFPTVSLTDIYAVVTYYLTNQATIDAYIAEVHREAEARRQAFEANDPKAQAFNQKMRDLLNQTPRTDSE